MKAPNSLSPLIISFLLGPNVLNSVLCYSPNLHVRLKMWIYEEYRLLVVTHCGCCKNRRLGGGRGTPFIMVKTISELVTANIVPSSPILFNLMMEAISSTEASVLTRATRLHRRRIPHSHRRGKLKSYMWT
jgi:hypothetical protein